MVAPARRAAFDILCQTEMSRAHSDDLMHSSKIESIAQRDRNLATDLVYGILRWRGRLDYVLAAVSSRPWQGVPPRAASKSAPTVSSMSIWPDWRPR